MELQWGRGLGVNWGLAIEALSIVEPWLLNPRFADLAAYQDVEFLQSCVVRVEFANTCQPLRRRKMNRIISS